MADRVASELVGVRDGTVPKLRAEGALQGGPLHRFRAVIALAASGNGLFAQADNVLLAEVPQGHVFAFGIVNNSATLGTAQLAIGTSKTHGSNGQLRAAAVKTSTTPEVFGPSTAMDDAPLTAPTRYYATVGVADMPTSGVIVIDLYFSAAG